VVGAILAASLTLLVAWPTGAVQASGYRAPRTAAGAPDLQGIWTNMSVTLLQRPAGVTSLVLTPAEAAALEGRFARSLGGLISEAPVDPAAPAPPETEAVESSDFIEMEMKLARVRGEIRSSWIIDPPDGRLPFTEAGRKAAGEAARRARVDFDGPESRPTAERCLTGVGAPEGPPMLNTGYNGHYQIVQTADHVAILVEMNHDVRIIPLSGRKPAPSGVPKWMGESVGWWDGETLVVETTHLQGGVWSYGGGFPYSPQAKVIERLTRVAKDEILYEFLVEDPVIFTRPWRGEMPMRAAKGPLYESACHEGNYSLPNILGGARAQEAAAKAQRVPPAADGGAR